MRNAAIAVGAVTAALLVTAIAAITLGYDPSRLVSTAIRGSLGSQYAVGESIVKSIPLVLTGLAVVAAFRAGIWNIGMEGQFIAGAIASLMAALALPAGALGASLALAAGAAGGALWSSIATWLKLKRNAPEVVTTILLNFIAVHLLGWSVNGPLQENPARYPQSAAVPEESLLPALGGTRLHAGAVIAVAAALLLSWLLYRTRAGLRLRAVGAGREAAAFAGINVESHLALAMALSGALAGLAGAVELLGVTTRLYERFAAGFGYSGIAVALLASLSPVGTLVSGLFLGLVATAAGELQRGMGVPASVATLVQALVILAILVSMSRPRWLLSVATPPAPHPPEEDGRAA